jgi:hypothetical protein
MGSTECNGLCWKFSLRQANKFSNDIDFEYPSAPAQGQAFASLFTELRTAFDKLASQKGDSEPYQLTAAVSAGAANYASLVVPQMDQALSYWNLMARRPFLIYKSTSLMSSTGLRLCWFLAELH